MSEMVKIFVNGQEVEVEEGKNLIDALAAVGIEIPHFCYHPALGDDGNCRMCLVEIEGGRPPIVPACKTLAQEGMSVRLDTDQVKKIQRNILELELINHPIDCPVCDQAGECSLQNYYMTYGLYDSRMRVEKVQKGKKMDFGSGIIHDQERCVLCKRCVRFLRNITKTAELGVVNRGDSAKISIFPGHPINNRYALNLVELCPVGALTSKDFRFRQRAWFLKTAKSVCHGCSKGCSIYIDHNREKYKDDVIYRFRSRVNQQVNGWFICDEGRLSYKKENENRLTQATMGKNVVEFDEALKAACQMLKGAGKKVTLVVSPNSTIEQMYAICQLGKHLSGFVSGYSDGYRLPGDGDDFLIEDDKSANRKSFEILGISQEKEQFCKYIEASDLVICFDNNLLAGASDEEKAMMAERLKGRKFVSIASHSLPINELADISLPCASFSEYDGCVINSAGILQKIEKAVCKNKEPKTVHEIAVALSGGFVDLDLGAIRKRIFGESGIFAGVNYDEVPEEGIKLQNTGVAYVPA
jgi:NADH-quinone oxidoreductase subunit G